MKVIRDWLRKPRSRVVVVAGAVFCIGFLCVLVVVARDDNHHQAPSSGSPFIYDKVECDAYVDQFPELMWLCGAEEICETLSNKNTIVPMSCSFDNAIKGLKAVDMFISGGYPEYLEFATLQPKSRRLLWDQFCLAQDDIHFILDHYPGFTREELIEVIKLSVLLYDMKNSNKMRAKAWVYGISVEDEFDLHCEVLRNHLEIFPSYANLKLKQKKLVSDIVTHTFMEKMFFFTSVYSILEKFLDITKDENLRGQFDLAFFAHQCRIAGRGKKVDKVAIYGLDRLVFENQGLFKKSCIIASECSLEEGYEYYLSRRAEWLGLDVTSPLSRTLVMVGSILNCYTPVEGAIIREAFFSLKPGDISFLSTWLEDVSTVADDSCRYLTHFMNNLKKNSQIGTTEEKRLSNAVTIALPFVSDVLSTKKAQQINESKPIDFNQVAELVKVDPSAVKQCKPRISSDGKVFL